MEITLQAELRSGTGKGFARKMRAAGKVPGVLYGGGMDSTPIAIERRALANAFTGGAAKLVDLAIDGQVYLTLAREMQRHPLRGDITHIDFLKIDRDQSIEIDVPIHVSGDSHGVREGGVVEHHLWSVRVSCLPGNVPERIDIDITPLGLHEHFRVGDLVAPSNVTIVTEADEAILTIAVPQVLKVEAELEQPEVVAEGEAPAEGAPAAPAEGAPPAGEQPASP
ncbi:MAG: 50S ribosomal protein L25 [Actinomycetota bacterium]